jgi:hypothetical protein
MFEDILDGFKELEDELEKDAAQLGLGVPEPEDWDTGKDDNWDAGEGGSGDKVWRT